MCQFYQKHNISNLQEIRDFFFFLCGNSLMLYSSLAVEFLTLQLPIHIIHLIVQ